MKIYILCDMEGISGIRQIEQVKIDGGPKYDEGCRLMMEDINAAVAGCFDGGATEVLVADTHGGGGQLRLEAMDTRATYETPGGGRLMPGLDESFSGVILLGHHARAGTRDAFLEHTVSSAAWFEYRCNGQVLGEIGLEAAYAGHYNVPVILVSGDGAACTEANADLGEDLVTVAVKWAVVRNRARCLPPSVARERIRQGAARAVQTAGTRQPFRPALPATIELTLHRCDIAEQTIRDGRTERVDGRTIRRKIDSLLEITAF